MNVQYSNTLQSTFYKLQTGHLQARIFKKLNSTVLLIIYEWEMVDLNQAHTRFNLWLLELIFHKFNL